MINQYDITTEESFIVSDLNDMIPSGLREDKKENKNTSESENALNVATTSVAVTKRSFEENLDSSIRDQPSNEDTDEARTMAMWNDQLNISGFISKPL